MCVLARDVSGCVDGIFRFRGLTFTAADDEVLVGAAEDRSDDEFALLVGLEALDDFAGVDFHELDLVWVHADEHVA